jgi:hypothetical protein
MFTEAEAVAGTQNSATAVGVAVSVTQAPEPQSAFVVQVPGSGSSMQ